MVGGVSHFKKSTYCSVIFLATAVICINERHWPSYGEILSEFLPLLTI